MRFVALLRGINVGGKNKVDMKLLAATFEAAGMQHVRTYINSGNVIFESSVRSQAKLTRLLEKAVETRCGFHVRVLLRDREQLSAVVRAMPDDWRTDSEASSDVLFLFEEAETPDVLDQLALKPGLDDVRYVPGAILWRVRRGDLTRSGKMKLAGSPLYAQVTVRNCNTVRKIFALMDTPR